MSKTKVERPQIVKDEHISRLDKLRDRGSVNTTVANKALTEDFELSKEDAATVVTYWLDSFTERY